MSKDYREHPEFKFPELTDDTRAKCNGGKPHVHASERAPFLASIIAAKESQYTPDQLAALQAPGKSFGIGADEAEARMERFVEPGVRTYLDRYGKAPEGAVTQDGQPKPTRC